MPIDNLKFLTASIGVAMALTLQPAIADGSGDDRIRADIRSPDEVYDGYLFWHQADELREDVDNISILTDSQGNELHVWETNLTGGGTPGYLLADGGVLRTGITDKRNARRGPIASTDTVQITDVNGEIRWQVNAKQFGDMLFHHDVELMPNGNLLISTYEPMTAAEAKALGWDPGDQAQAWTDGIIEVSPDFDTGESMLVWHWRVADHFVQDKYPEAANYGVVAEHPERINPNFPKSYAPRNVPRQHINSVDYNPQLDQILLSAFIYDEIWIIDHSTSSEEAASSKGGRSGKGGDLLFRYGNPAAYNHGTIKDRKFLKQHDANWINTDLPGAGNILVHNNNTVFKPIRQTPGAAAASQERREDLDIDVQEGRSNVYELALPVTEDGNYRLAEDATFKADVVWLWEHPEYFADFQGGARRLPNGNTLITDTTDDLVVEVNADGEIVAQYHGATPVFKAFKYSPEFVLPSLIKP